MTLSVKPLSSLVYKGFYEKLSNPPLPPLEKGGEGGFDNRFMSKVYQKKK